MSDPLVTFSFDDGRSTAVKFGARILEEHSARGTFYPITQCVGTENEHGAYATWEDLRRLDGNGHEVGNHSYSHVREWTTWPARDQLADIEKAGIALMRACFLPPRTFAYPFGLHDAQLRQAVQEACNRSYGAARTIEPGINTPETDPFLLASFMVE